MKNFIKSETNYKKILSTFSFTIVKLSTNVIELLKRHCILSGKQEIEAMDSEIFVLICVSMEDWKK